MQKKILIIIGIIILVAVILGGLLFYKGYIYAEEINKQIGLCEQEYQKVAKTHLPYFNTFDYINRTSCYTNIAIKEDYLAICDRVDDKNSPYTLDCYVKFAVAKNDLSACKKLNNVQGCEKNVEANVEYLNKNNIYINPIKYGNVKIITPKDGEVLDKDKEYKITWITDSFSDKDFIDQLTFQKYGDNNGSYITTKLIPAKQGYYYFIPSSILGIELGKKYYIRLSAAGDPNNNDPKLRGTSELFEFK